FGSMSTRSKFAYDDRSGTVRAADRRERLLSRTADVVPSRNLTMRRPPTYVAPDRPVRSSDFTARRAIAHWRTGPSATPASTPFSTAGSGYGESSTRRCCAGFWPWPRTPASITNADAAARVAKNDTDGRSTDAL